ncbi:hypothetical protein C0389_05070 [bacterium]|nr:hypothetical protein [bacterium]
MKVFKLLTIVYMVLFSVCIAQNKTQIKGKVTDGKEPIAFASVYIAGSTEGTTSDENGNFSFSTKKKGKVFVIATMVGYEKLSHEIDIDKQTNVEVELKLEQSIIKLSGVVVTASSYGSLKEKGLVLSSRDVMMTPGGAGDLFQSLKTLPGVTPVSEGAQLYVRGGDPIETVTMLDQASIYHPYTFETSNGSLFSNINTALIKDMFFSSGGFSAKYGNVLSGVLDIETKELPEVAAYSIGLSMANASVNARVPITNKIGIQLNARQSFTKPIFILNGGLDRLVVTPSSSDLSTIINYKYSDTGKLKLTFFLNTDKQGVNLERAEYVGTFDGTSNNILIALQNTDVLSSSIVSKTSLSFNTYDNLWKIGLLDLKTTDYNYKLRNDLQITLTTSFRFNTGFEIEKRVSKFEGIIPREDYDIRPGSTFDVINAQLSGSRIGAYTEVEMINLLGFQSLSTSFGIRADYIPELKLSWIDPRFSFAYKYDDFTIFAFGLGIFRQLPNPRLFSDSDGNPNLGPMKASHIIFSFNRTIGDAEDLRIETYYKKYEELPLENKTLNYDNNGSGFAKGLDIILKSKNFFGINGWISYGIMETKRKWMDFEELFSSNYDITHNLNLVATYMLSDSWMVGVNCKIATGRPYSPIIGSIFHSQEQIYEPVYGVKNSERFSTYKRIDLRVLYLFQLFSKYSAVFFLEGLNIFDFGNIFGYTYYKDYSSKKEVESYFGRRMLVFGANVNL